MKAGLKTRLYGVQVKLAALFSLPGAPVNFGHFGHSHSGRERLVRVPVDSGQSGRRLALLDPVLQVVRLSIFALNGPKPWPKPGIM